MAAKSLIMDTGIRLSVSVSQLTYGAAILYLYRAGNGQCHCIELRGIDLRQIQEVGYQGIDVFIVSTGQASFDMDNGLTLLEIGQPHECLGASDITCKYIHIRNLSLE